jgi:hypothetical protein
MNEDLVSRLRLVNPYAAQVVSELCWEAANEIDRLYSEINDLRLQVVALSTPQQAYRG